MAQVFPIIKIINPTIEISFDIRLIIILIGFAFLLSGVFFYYWFKGRLSEVSPSVQTCPHCGRTQSSDSVFCGFCGKKFLEL